MRSKNRQLLPQPNDIYVQVPGRQGSILFPRELADRRIELDCAFVGSSLANIRTKARDIAAWLNTTDRASLSFDDETGKTYKAKLASAVDFDHVAKVGQFSLSFDCEPLAYGKQVTVDFALDATTINYLGTYMTAPIFEATFTAATDQWRVTKGSDYIRINHDFQIGDELYIDWQSGLITINGQRAMNKMDWQNSHFFYILPGVNYLSITPTGKCIAKMKHTPTWL